MQAIKNINDIQQALSGQTPHETLVDITAFAARHLEEMRELQDSDKNTLFSRLVTETYDNEELEPVITVTEQLFKEKIGENFDQEGLNGLSQTEKLHLFRYTNQQGVKCASNLANMTKRKRERILYSSMLTPILSEKVSGEDLETAIRKCTRALQQLPKEEREKHLHFFKKYLPFFSNISSGFGQLVEHLPLYSKKLSYLDGKGFKFTISDPSTLLAVLSFQLPQEQFVSFVELCTLFPKLDQEGLILHTNKTIDCYPINQQQRSENPNTTAQKIAQKFPVLFQAQSLREIQTVVDLGEIQDEEIEGLQEMFEKCLEQFPHLNSNYAELLKTLSELDKEEINQALEKLKVEPFTEITSGEKLAFCIKKVVESDGEIELLKRFCKAFPNVHIWLEQLYLLVKEDSEIFTAIENSSIGQLPETERSRSSLIIEPIIQQSKDLREITSNLDLFTKCAQSFPKITDHYKLSEAILKMNDTSKEVLRFIITNFSHLPFETVDDIAYLPLEYKDIPIHDFHTSHSATLRDNLTAFKAYFLDPFPLAKGSLKLRLQWLFAAPNILISLINTRFFFNETSGNILCFYMKLLHENENVRNEELQFFQRVVTTFRQPYQHELFHFLRDPEANHLIDLIHKKAPDAVYYFKENSDLLDLLKFLKPLSKEQRTQYLDLFQRHLQQSQDNYIVPLITKVPLEEQEAILDILEKFNFLEKVESYCDFFYEIKKIEQGKREKHLELFQRHLQYSEYRHLPNLLKIPAEEQESILDLLDDFTFPNIKREYLFLVEALLKVDQAERRARLELCLKHLQLNQEAYLPSLVKISAEDLESTLSQFDGIDFLDEVEDYASLVSNLSKLNSEEKEALFSKSGEFQTFLNTLESNKKKAAYLLIFSEFTVDEQSLALKNLKVLIELVAPDEFEIDRKRLTFLPLIPSSLIASIKPEPEGKHIKMIFQELRDGENHQTLSEHLISLLNGTSSNLDALTKLLRKVESMANKLCLRTYNSPLGKTIAHYRKLLSD